ncbi:MAG: class I SAM-dependent methyltransferase [Candidatus Sulfotelmatobacter sp.]
MIDLAAITLNLQQTPEGIWRSKLASQVSYPEWGNETFFELEDDSFWFRHRNACILAAMKRYPPSGPVFDIGGGNGFVARGMQDLTLEVVLLEPGLLGCRNARSRGIRNVVCASLEDVGFTPASVDAAGLFDVVEHIEDDAKFMEAIRRYLRLHGRVYLTVPAYQSLWSHEDVDAGHFRRYSARALRDLLETTGFSVELLTGFFQFLPPAILAGRVIPYHLRLAKPGAQVNSKVRNQHHVGNSLIRKTLSFLERREVTQISDGREATFGGSWLAVARKI